MSLAEIRHASDESAREAAKSKKQPYVPFDEREIKEWKFKIPNLGGYVPKGWKFVEAWFCDHSGFGAEGEGALTFDQLKHKMLEQLKMPSVYGYGITESGPFQCYVGVFKLTAIKKRKKAA